MLTVYSQTNKPQPIGWRIYILCGKTTDRFFVWCVVVVDQMPTRLERAVRIDGADGLLADMGSSLAVIITHPWGPLGGNMQNNVVSAAAVFFQRQGITTLRFDFVGSQIGRGHRQVQQVEAAAKYVLFGQQQQQQQEQPRRAPNYVLLFGYSYGSLIAASASAKIPQCVGCISVAPPWSVKHWLLMFHSNHHMRQAKQRESLPRLMVQGSHDNFTKEGTFLAMVETFPASYTTAAVLKDADHFFHRREKDLLDVVGEWLVETYPQCNGNLRDLAHLEYTIRLEGFMASKMSDEDKSEWGNVFGTCGQVCN